MPVPIQAEMALGHWVTGSSISTGSLGPGSRDELGHWVTGSANFVTGSWVNLWLKIFHYKNRRYHLVNLYGQRYRGSDYLVSQ